MKCVGFEVCWTGSNNRHKKRHEGLFSSCTNVFVLAYVLSSWSVEFLHTMSVSYIQVLAVKQVHPTLIKPTPGKSLCISQYTRILSLVSVATPPCRCTGSSVFYVNQQTLIYQSFAKVPHCSLNTQHMWMRLVREIKWRQGSQ